MLFCFNAVMVAITVFICEVSKLVIEQHEETERGISIFSFKRIPHDVAAKKEGGKAEFSYNGSSMLCLYLLRAPEVIVKAKLEIVVNICGTIVVAVVVAVAVKWSWECRVGAMRYQSSIDRGYSEMIGHPGEIEEKKEMHQFSGHRWLFFDQTSHPPTCFCFDTWCDSARRVRGGNRFWPLETGWLLLPSCQSSNQSLVAWQDCKEKKNYYYLTGNDGTLLECQPQWLWQSCRSLLEPLKLHWNFHGAIFMQCDIVLGPECARTSIFGVRLWWLNEKKIADISASLKKRGAQSTCLHFGLSNKRVDSIASGVEWNALPEWHQGGIPQLTFGICKRHVRLAEVLPRKGTKKSSSEN